MSKIELIRTDFKIFWETRVRYYELNPQGIMHNANYLAYYDQAVVSFDTEATPLSSELEQRLTNIRKTTHRKEFLLFMLLCYSKLFLKVFCYCCRFSCFYICVNMNDFTSVR